MDKLFCGPMPIKEPDTSTILENEHISTENNHKLTGRQRLEDYLEKRKLDKMINDEEL